jgi:hypothetical protein
MGGMFVPFPDGSSVQMWEDDEKCEAEIKRFAPGDLEGRWEGRPCNSLIATLRADSTPIKSATSHQYTCGGSVQRAVLHGQQVDHALRKVNTFCPRRGPLLCPTFSRRLTFRANAQGGGPCTHSRPACVTPCDPTTPRATSGSAPPPAERRSSRDWTSRSAGLSTVTRHHAFLPKGSTQKDGSSRSKPLLYPDCIHFRDIVMRRCTTRATALRKASLQPNQTRSRLSW